MIDVEYFLAGFWSLDWLWKKGKTGFVVAGGTGSQWLWYTPEEI